MSKESFLYMQICDRIRSDILSGVYKTGERLPTDHELQEELGVSLITIKKAFGILKDEGFITRSPGVGTKVLTSTPSAAAVSTSALAEASSAQVSAASDNVSSKKKKIGIVLENVSDSFGFEMLYHLDELLSAKGYQTCIRFSNYNRKKETKEIRELLEEHISALMIMPCHGTYYNSQILKLVLDHFPVILIDKKMEGIPVPSIRTDNRDATHILMKDLYGHGCRNICLFTRDISGTSSLQERFDGYQAAIKKYKLTPHVLSIASTDQPFHSLPCDAETYQQVAEYLLENVDNLDGIICSEYNLCGVLAKVLRRTPELSKKELHLRYIDGEPEGLSSGLYPHIIQDQKAIAEKAVEILLEKMANKKVVQEYLIPAKLENGVYSVFQNL
ncbi:MAG: GntR family transcriptional regulator [Lachnospiraceae bacterium]|nr:GntR family transcriptional regulator [Lachnospiraceae bacterium]